MYKRIVLLAGGLFLAMIAVIAAPLGGSAHERRDVAGGQYRFVVGFLNEPAFQGELNAISVRITKPAPPEATPAPGRKRFRAHRSRDLRRVSSSRSSTVTRRRAAGRDRLS
jgi:hypothetical protein